MAVERVNVSVPEELIAEARKLDLSVSAICRAALAAAVEKARSTVTLTLTTEQVDAVCAALMRFAADYGTRTHADAAEPGTAERYRALAGVIAGQLERQGVYADGDG